MTDTKVNLYVTLPGRTMYSKQLCFKNSKIRNKKGQIVNVETPIDGMTTTETFFLDVRDKNTGKITRNRYTYHLRKCIPAKQVVHLSKEAFEAMTSEEVPNWARRLFPKATIPTWKSLTPEQRLAYHLEVLAEALGGKVESYQVLED